MAERHHATQATAAKAAPEKGAAERESGAMRLGAPVIALIVIAAILLAVNQAQIFAISGALYGSGGAKGPSIGFLSSVLQAGSSDGADLSKVDVSKIKSTADTIAAVFPLDKMKTADGAMAAMFPTGTPEYGTEMGVSFDDPIKSLDLLAKSYPSLKDDVKKNNPEAFQRFIGFATKPVGISCEYCCGIGPTGADSNGNSLCGCQHNPAMLSVALWLSANRPNYSDGQILYEAMKWKTLFFPKDMVTLGLNVAGGDAGPGAASLPSQVGGC